MSMSATEIEPVTSSAVATEPVAEPQRLAAPIEDPQLIIKPRRGWIGVDWRELLSHRELLFFLIWRDVKVKYKQAILGFAWALFVPVISMMLFTFIGKASGWDKLVPAGIPYPVFVYAGLLPWLFLQASINNGGMSLISQQNLLTKIYMPRLFMPMATIGGGLVDMSLSLLVLCGVMGYYGYHPYWSHLLAFPLLLGLAITCGLGCAFLLSALTVNFRDMRFLIPFLSQILLWISAAVYPARIFAGHDQWLAINPLYGIIAAFIWMLVRDMPLNRVAVMISVVESLVLFVVGLFYFKRAERRFADIA
jgi:lipopolysaccharide transport system permease protein